MNELRRFKRHILRLESHGVRHLALRRQFNAQLQAHRFRRFKLQAGGGIRPLVQRYFNNKFSTMKPPLTVRTFPAFMSRGHLSSAWTRNYSTYLNELTEEIRKEEKFQESISFPAESTEEEKQTGSGKFTEVELNTKEEIKKAERKPEQIASKEIQMVGAGLNTIVKHIQTIVDKKTHQIYTAAIEETLKQNPPPHVRVSISKEDHSRLQKRFDEGKLTHLKDVKLLFTNYYPEESRQHQLVTTKITDMMKEIDVLDIIKQELAVYNYQEAKQRPPPSTPKPQLCVAPCVCACPSKTETS